MALQNWKTNFDELFSDLRDPWHLEIVSDIVKESGWSKLKHRGRATFKCSKCNNTWPCINSGVVFYFRSSGSHSERRGEVKLFLGGQKCITCKDVFEDAEWSDTEIEKATTKVLNEIKQEFYGAFRSPEPDTEHDDCLIALHQRFSNFCQLCSLGACADVKSGKNHFTIVFYFQCSSHRTSSKNK